MKKNLLIMTLLFCAKLVFSKEPYQIVDSGYIASAAHEIKNMPIQRSQDGLGLCYGFSSTTLLNYQYCKQNNLDCSKMENALSTIDISSFYQYGQRQVNIGGYPAAILSNIKYEKESKGQKLRKEKCLPYDRLANKLSEDPETAQSEALTKLSIIYNKRERDNFDTLKNCYAQEVNNILPISKNLDEIIKAFDAFSFEEFLFDLVDTKCGSDDSVEIPNYFMASSQIGRDKLTPVKMIKKLENLILNDIPVGLNFCASESYDPNNKESCGGHAVVLSGIKEVCKENTCKTLIKVQNSYGEGWQASHNDGWLDAGPLIKRSLEQGFTNSLIWISSYESEADIPTKSLKRKVPLNEQDLLTIPSGPPSSIDQSRGPIYKCAGGKITTKWKDDSGCILDQYMKK